MFHIVFTILNLMELYFFSFEGCYQIYRLEEIHVRKNFSNFSHSVSKFFVIS